MAFPQACLPGRHTTDSVLDDLEEVKIMSSAKEPLRVGYGSCTENDRIEPGVLLAEKGDVRYVCFDTLAERTLAHRQMKRLADPTAGYNPHMEARIRALLPFCLKNHVRAIGNFGGANPLSAADLVMKVIQETGASGIKVATVLGDDVRYLLTPDLELWETGEPLGRLEGEIVSANAYLGADPIVAALREGADIIITGRVADPSLFLAPLIFEFGWRCDDWHRLGAGIVLGHLVECATHVTGGSYFDPGYTEDVPGLGYLGCPIVEAFESGEGIITKLPGTGGGVSVNSCKAQLLYEIHNPAEYITPDVIADFRNVTLTHLGKDRVRVSGGKGKARPECLKVSVGVLEGYIGEGQIGWAGPGCYEKAKCAAEAVKQNLKPVMGDIDELRIDFMGVNSVFGPAAPEPATSPNEVRLRVAGRTKKEEVADTIGHEVEMMYFGPLGAGGAWRNVRRVLSMYSTLMHRNKVPAKVITNEITLREVK